MKVLIVILLLALLAKDVSHIDDPNNIMRGFAQGLCFFVGGIWVLSNINLALMKKYWPVFGYLLVSLVSGLLSPIMETALIQTASLVAVLFFAIAYFELQSRRPGDPTDLYFNTTILAYAVVCSISLLMVKLNPSIAYGIVGQWVTNPEAAIRFRGIYPVSGMLGAASGLLAGFVLFRQGKWWWRAPVLGVGLACLALTQSRTFWVATFVTSILIWWVYRPRYRKLLAAVTLGVGIMVVTVEMLGLNVDTRDLSKAARAGSVSTLTGRIPLWENAMEAFSERPFIGYGSTLGSYALEYGSDNTNASFSHEKREGRSLSTETMHNGYFQTMLDLGLFGTFFYVMIFVTAIRRIYLRDKLRKYGAVSYAVVFMAIANMGESIVYSAAVSHSIVFWIAVVFALHRFTPEPVKRVQNEKPAANKNIEAAENKTTLTSRKRNLA